MRKTCTGFVAGVAGVLVLSALVAAQGAPQKNAPRSPWKYYPEDARANEGPGGPAPVRDMSGTWAGEAANDATNDETCDAEGAHRQTLGGVRVDTLTLRLRRKTASRGGVTRLTGLTTPKCCRRRMTACDAGEGEQRQDVREREEKLIGQCPSERLKHELQGTGCAKEDGRNGDSDRRPSAERHNGNRDEPTAG